MSMLQETLHWWWILSLGVWRRLQWDPTLSGPLWHRIHVQQVRTAILFLKHVQNCVSEWRIALAGLERWPMMTVLRMRPVQRNTTRESAASRCLVGITRWLHTNVLTGLKSTLTNYRRFIIYRIEGCYCWEKKADSTPCEKRACPKVKGLKGRCGVEPPAKGYVKTDYRCEEK